ncbi:hypothetical protein ABIF65_011875 [Bradyrhizobium japonicum]|nr:hypothetical protein [Bradyrhizobium japonicum]MCP1784704.1 hypothetical protein [Bradyrhizobium japonicum]MCP1794817.1 hypothetical protein [Bradyrhizobium japonicum]MCP1810742.1 hypothetical protein [Bradyrhizobium japonicum]MCP1821499.1 hypothetical protein [Bradyrhizobium japonicum]
MFKLIDAASKTWRRLKGTNQLPKLIAGVGFDDGIEVSRSHPINVSPTHGDDRDAFSAVAPAALSS